MHRTPKSVLGFSKAEIQRGSLAFHLSTWNGNTGFLSGPSFIRTKKEQHIQNSGSISTSQYCSTFQDSFIVLDVLKAVSQAWSQSWHFSRMQKSHFSSMQRQYLRAMSHFTATSGLDSEALEKFSGSASLYLRTLTMAVLSDHDCHNLQRSEKIVNFSKESHKF